MGGTPILIICWSMIIEYVQHDVLAALRCCCWSRRRWGWSRRCSTATAISWIVVAALSVCLVINGIATIPILGAVGGGRCGTVHAIAGTTPSTLTPVGGARTTAGGGWYWGRWWRRRRRSGTPRTVPWVVVPALAVGSMGICVAAVSVLGAIGVVGSGTVHIVAGTTPSTLAPIGRACSSTSLKGSGRSS